MRGSPDQEVPILSSFPLAQNNWSGPWNTDMEWKPKYIGATSQDTKQYKKDGKKAYLYIAYYNGRSEGSEMVGSENKLISTDLWHQVGKNKYSLVLGEEGNAKLSINETTIKSNRQTVMLWQWFIVGGHAVDNPILAKIYELKARFSGKTPASASIVVAADYLDEPDEARLVLEEFVRDMLPAVVVSVGT